MTQDQIDRYATCIFLTARTESNIGDVTDRPLDDTIKIGSKFVKREIVEFAVDLLQTVGRELNSQEISPNELISNTISKLEHLKWEAP
jgi:hypothetical protein